MFVAGGHLDETFLYGGSCICVLTLGVSARLVAHEGHEHKVMGTVTMAAADHLMLKDKDGKDVTVKVTADTSRPSRP